MRSTIRLCVAVALIAFAMFSKTIPALAQVGFTEQEVRFQGAEAPLAGTLTLPDAQGQVPAVILISGSGPQDRNESLPGITELQPFRIIAEHLGSAGIAVLRFDDRGTGQSGGAFLGSTSEDFARDVEAALAFLKTRSEIDPEKIGLLGHSEGGMIAPLVAAENPDAVAYVITMAGVAVPGYELLIGQLEHLLDRRGLTGVEREQAFTQEAASLDMTVQEDWAGVERFLQGQYAMLSGEQRAAVGSLDTFVQQGLAHHQGWLHYFATHDPAEDWQRVDVPILALYGDKDVQVPAQENAEAFEAALNEGGNQKVTVIRFPEANHLFQRAVTGEPDEYGNLPPEFIPEFLPTISRWILERTSE